MKMPSKRDNRGMSLVELIIVMAIMAVLASAVSIGVNLVTNKAADKCATQLKASVQSARVTTMGKFRVYLKISMDVNGNGLCIEEYVWSTDSTKEEDCTKSVNYTGDANVKVEFKLSGSEEYYTLGNGVGEIPYLYIEFDRSSGALKRLPNDMGDLAGNYCTEIKISRGSRERKIYFAYLTGKVTME